jgi:cyclophilin family peptidyl-prolyl cis-trans isomerase
MLARGTRAGLLAVALFTTAGAPSAYGAEDQAIQEIDRFIAEQKVDTSQSGWKTRLAKPPKASFDVAKKYFWRLETNVGSVKVRLMPDVAPMHVSSTIYLTRLGFYDGLGFHRVITGFMAQGGDPLGNGTGGPGYKYAGEFSPAVKHDRPGLLSMANAGPGTDGSQFFLTFVPTPWLDGKHTLFGEVVEGKETLRELEKRGSSSGRTSEKLEIRKASIVVE